MIDNDPVGEFCFSSMQSPVGRELLEACGRPSDDLSTFVLIDDAGARNRPQMYTRKPL